MLKKIIIITPFMTCSNLILLHAQIVSGKNEVGISIGTFIYQGDLAPSALGSLKTPKPSLCLYYNRIISPYFSIRASLANGSIKGDESKYSYKPYRQRRNFNFSSSVTEVFALLIFNPFGNSNYSRFSPYVFAGADYTFLNVKRDWSNTNISSFHPGSPILAGLAVDTVHSLPKGIPVIPLGFGIKYALTSRISLTAESSYRYAFTDYLDGFSYAANPAKKRQLLQCISWAGI